MKKNLGLILSFVSKYNLVVLFLGDQFTWLQWRLSNMFAFLVSAFLGASIMFLGALRLLDLVNLSSSYIFSFSISAMLFAIADFLYFFYEMVETEEDEVKEILDDRTKSIYRRFEIFAAYCCGLAIFSITILPQLKIIQNLQGKILTTLNDVTLLIGLGLVITLIALKGVVQVRNQRIKFKAEKTKLLKIIEEHASTEEQK